MTEPIKNLTITPTQNFLTKQNSKQSTTSGSYKESINERLTIIISVNKTRVNRSGI